MEIFASQVHGKRPLATYNPLMTAFLKMHGLGNDFVVFDAREHALALTGDQARAVADRHFGIGCDTGGGDPSRRRGRRRQPCCSTMPMARNRKAAAMPRAAWRAS